MRIGLISGAVATSQFIQGLKQGREEEKSFLRSSASAAKKSGVGALKAGFSALTVSYVLHKAGDLGKWLVRNKRKKAWKTLKYSFIANHLGLILTAAGVVALTGAAIYLGYRIRNSMTTASQGDLDQERLAFNWDEKTNSQWVELIREAPTNDEVDNENLGHPTYENEDPRSMLNGNGIAPTDIVYSKPGFGHRQTDLNSGTHQSPALNTIGVTAFMLKIVEKEWPPEQIFELFTTLFGYHRPRWSGGTEMAGKITGRLRHRVLHRGYKEYTKEKYEQLIKRQTYQHTILTVPSGTFMNYMRDYEVDIDPAGPDKLDEDLEQQYLHESEHDADRSSLSTIRGGRFLEYMHSSDRVRRLKPPPLKNNEWANAWSLKDMTFLNRPPETNWGWEDEGEDAEEDEDEDVNGPSEYVEEIQKIPVS
eukprot:Nk52_evm60s153 gene=Nk52_evmTU60s153